jgi:diguanylate cyclase (GGDEF)-like protein
MSIQRKLTLAFVFIVAVTLSVAGLILRGVIVGEASRRAVISLRPALEATAAIYQDQSDGLDHRVRATIEGDRRFGPLLAVENGDGLSALLQDKLEESEDLDFLIALDENGSVIASAQRPGNFLVGFEEPAPADIVGAQPGTGPGFARTPEIPVQVAGQGTQGRVIGGFWIDNDLLIAASRSELDLSVVVGNRIVASTIPLGKPITIDVDYRDAFDANLDERSKAAASSLGRGVGVVASTPTAPIDALSRQILTSMFALLLLALLGTLGLAYFLARLVTQPLQELAEGARAIQEGQYGYMIPVRSKDEVGELGATFNDMSTELTRTMSALTSSRDQMQRAVRRVGETLRSTHDMKQMLDSILSTSKDAVEAEAAVLWMFTPTREELYPALSNGTETDGSRVKVGEGVVGFVAERAKALLLPATDGAPKFSRHEPALPVAMAVPLYSQDKMMGVISTYRHDPNSPFHEEDLDTVTFLAEQGGVAIENVRLHEEAQRLSLTDGLTGVFNRRYFQMQFRQVLATAIRFERPFSTLMLDLDLFKLVNDRHGHQRGDAILIEFSQRVTSMVREVDTFARYGGEEFICLLSETDVQGAMTTAEKIRDAIRGEPFGTMDEELLNLTVSIGVSSYPEHGDSFKALVEAADQALYRAKQLGRDQVQLAPPDLHAAG